MKKLVLVDNRCEISILLFPVYLTKNYDLITHLIH